jgi:hypothetical protein
MRCFLYGPCTIKYSIYSIYIYIYIYIYIRYIAKGKYATTLCQNFLFSAQQLARIDLVNPSSIRLRHILRERFKRKSSVVPICRPHNLTHMLSQPDSLTMLTIKDRHSSTSSLPHITGLQLIATLLCLNHDVASEDKLMRHSRL